MVSAAVRAWLVVSTFAGCLVVDAIRSEAPSPGEQPGSTMDGAGDGAGTNSDPGGPTGVTGTMEATGVVIPSGPTGCVDSSCSGNDICIAGACAPPPASCADPAWLPDRPVLLLTDLSSGPTTGGENDRGVFVTLYGERFGAQNTRSRVTMGGVDANIVAWAPDRAARGLDVIVVQPGAGTPSGNIIVWVEGNRSNALSFTVRAGNVFFVDPESTGASDGNDGRAPASAWRTINKARAVMAAGDTAYVLSHVNGAVTWTGANGSASQPIAIVGYPRADGAQVELRGTASSWTHSSGNFTTLANFKLIGFGLDASDTLQDLRVVGCTFTDNSGLAGQGLFDLAASRVVGRIRQYDFSANTRGPRIVWNEFDGALGALDSGVSLNVVGNGSWMNGSLFMGNLFTRFRKVQALMLDGVDGSGSAVHRVVNNVFVRDRQAAAPLPFVVVQNGDDMPIRFEFNTFLGFQVATRQSSGWNDAELVNNVFDVDGFLAGGESSAPLLQYVASESASDPDPSVAPRSALPAGMAGAFTGGGNLWNSAGPHASWDTGAPDGGSDLNADFGPKAASPAYRAALGPAPCGDYMGVLRPSPASIGARE